MWREVYDGVDLERCVEILKLGANHYGRLTTDKIKKGFDRKRGRHFLYNNGTQEIKQILKTPNSLQSTQI